uniref:Glycosyltransferase 2-like domain-containing protein n=1 Tax=Prevotella sp. GTC17254 TaxID=3236794 RepID=A0AB33J447_9BACT
MEKKRISVAMCTYNGELFLREQLDTLVTQTLLPDEIIIQDDHSTDGTLTILKEYAARYPFIRVCLNDGERGVNSNFFGALRKATGDLIAICDQDDLWEPTKLELQAAAIGDHLLCSCFSRPFSEDGSFASFDSRHPNTSLIRLLFASLPGHTMLINRKLIDLLPADNIIYGISLYDAILGMTAAAFDSIVFVDKVLVHQRRYARAATYTEFSGSLPTVGNAFRILRWSLCNYTKAKPHLQRYFRGRQALFRELHPDTQIYREGCRLIGLQLTNGPIAYIRLTCFFIRHRSRLFQTPGGGIVKWLRALLYPIMQMYNYRLWVKT